MDGRPTERLPMAPPFQEASHADTSSSHLPTPPPAKAGSRTGWSLWPLHTSSGVLSSRSNATTPSSSRRTSHQPIREHQSYPSSNSPSPPSPFGPSHHSDSSPPATPPDSAVVDLYPNSLQTPFTLDARESRGTEDHQHLSRPSPSVVSSSPSSRNNIFSSPAVSPVPAPRFQTSLDRVTPTKALSSRNASFFDSPTSQAASSPQQTGSRESLGHRRYGSMESVSDRPSYGRSSTEEREKERARIRQSNAEVDFRLCPVKDYLLGEGRHCTVYLGAYKRKRASPSQSDGDEASETWMLCAIKRLHADRQSQLLGLEEAFALRRLGSHPNIVKLINIRDEVELAATSPLPKTGESAWSGLAVPVVAPLNPGKGKVEAQSVGKGLPSSLSVVHGRSTSESQASDTLSSIDRVFASTQAHRRLASTPSKGPVVKIASPDGNEFSFSPSLPEGNMTENEGGAGSPDPPRLLIMLELLPYSLSSFAKRNSDRIKLSQWKKWALELASVVEWLHSKGCVHADLKPENVLLTSDLTVKLCDFNSALFPNPAQPLTDGLGLGTPAYGAPELASSKGFSYPVDIWSLGAILYTLAVGTEPFQKARSMIDILHRKRFFFESEENDRAASLSVAKGSGASTNGGSTTASRSGSLRGKKRGESEHTTATTRPGAVLQRESSSDSVSSLASSVMLSGSSGRNPSIGAISMLLENSPPSGIILPSGIHLCSNQPTYGSTAMTTSAHPSHGHHRAASLGKAQGSSHLSPTAAIRKHNFVSRPVVLRRTTSYGGVETCNESKEEDAGNGNGGTDQEQPPPSPLPNHPSKGPEPAGLRLAVTAALAQSNRIAQQHIHPDNDEVRSHERSISDELRDNSDEDMDDDDMDDDDMANDLKPYKDGSPSLLLPGGGRLPDAARDLLEIMLSADAEKRPSAAQVRRQLQAL